MTDIQQWLSDRHHDYAEGVAIFARHSANKGMVRTLSKGSARFWMGKLEYEMGKLAQQRAGREMGQDVSKKMSKMEVKTSEHSISQHVQMSKKMSKSSAIPEVIMSAKAEISSLYAIIDKMREFTPDDRFYIVEDAGEIQCHARDRVNIWAAGKDTLKAVGIALRCNVSRIIFGELRYGDVTNEVLKAWNTGHTGNAATIHADCCTSMITRVEDLLREVIPGELPDVAQSVQLLVHLKPTKNGPIVDEILETRNL